MTLVTLRTLMFIHVTSVVKQVHIFMFRSSASQDCLMADLCFHHFVHFGCVLISMSIYIYICLSVYLSICLSIYLFINQSIYLYMSIYIYIMYIYIYIYIYYFVHDNISVLLLTHCSVNIRQSNKYCQRCFSVVLSTLNGRW